MSHKAAKSQRKTTRESEVEIPDDVRRMPVAQIMPHAGGGYALVTCVLAFTPDGRVLVDALEVHERAPIYLAQAQLQREQAYQYQLIRSGRVPREGPAVSQWMTRRRAS